MKNEHTVRFTLNNLPPGRIDRTRVEGMSPEEIERTALADLDNPPATEEELAAGELVFPTDRRKVPTYIRFDPEILEFFRSEGPGYQTRINDVLLRYVRGKLQPVARHYQVRRVSERPAREVRLALRGVRGGTKPFGPVRS
jgi:uncharacterized protein (DUF4415 family)